MGVVDKSGAEVIDAKYKHLEISTNGKYFCVANDNGYGIIDINGKEIVPLQFDYVWPLIWANYELEYSFDYFDDNDPYLLAFKDGCYGIFNSNGEEIIDRSKLNKSSAAEWELKEWK